MAKPYNYICGEMVSPQSTNEVCMHLLLSLNKRIMEVRRVLPNMDRFDLSNVLTNEYMGFKDWRALPDGDDRQEASRVHAVMVRYLMFVEAAIAAGMTDAVAHKAWRKSRTVEWETI